MDPHELKERLFLKEGKEREATARRGGGAKNQLQDIFHH